MAKQIVAWCDLHLARDNEQVPASSVQVTLDHGMPMELDLCDPCHKELVEPLRLLLDEHGQPVKQDTRPTTSPTGRPLIPCPAPGCGKQYAQKRGLEKHMAKYHPEQADEQLPGFAPPAQGNDEDGYLCPECGRHFTRPQGVGRHRLSAHGVTGTSSRAVQRAAHKGEAKA